MFFFSVQSHHLVWLKEPKINIVDSADFTCYFNNFCDYNFLSVFYFILPMYECFACMYTRASEGIRFSGRDGNEPPCRSWEPNFSPLEEQGAQPPSQVSDFDYNLIVNIQ